MSELLTPSQTVGPYFSMRLPWPEGPYVVAEGAPGAVTIYGRLLRRGRRPDPGRADRDLAGRPGRPVRPPRRPARPGTGRGPDVPRLRPLRRPATTAPTRSSPSSPAPLPSGDGRTEAPHIDVSVFARGMLDRSVTRIYFPDEPAANEADPVLQTVPARRRATLIAAPAGDNLLRFDIRMQGEDETVFFDL